jgi:hypothetical protein
VEVEVERCDTRHACASGSEIIAALVGLRDQNVEKSSVYHESMRID